MPGWKNTPEKRAADARTYATGTSARSHANGVTAVRPLDATEQENTTP